MIEYQSENFSENIGKYSILLRGLCKLCKSCIENNEKYEIQKSRESEKK